MITAESGIEAFIIKLLRRHSTLPGGLALKKILLVKTSSLGDVVHNFPAATDIARHFPGAVVDWVVEEAYARLVCLHPAIRRAIPVAVRRWRRHCLAPATWREIGAWRKSVAAKHYDAVIDTQGLLKSAVLAGLAKGPRHGYDRSSAREPFATRFYHQLHRVSRTQHAVARNRQLVAASLGYQVADAVDYGLVVPGTAGQTQALFLHATSRSDKLWPEENWIELGRTVEAAGMVVCLPWGSSAERDRSVRIASNLAHAVVPSRKTLEEMAGLLREARFVVGVDTGLVHLAAALGLPVAALYCATDPALTGTYGAASAANLGGIHAMPSVEQVRDHLRNRGLL